MAGYIKKNNEFIPLTGDGYGLPLGTIIAYEGSVPDGFLACDGSAYNTTTYSALYALLGVGTTPNLTSQKMTNTDGWCIKATPAYVEPDTVSDMVHTMRVQDSYSTSEVNTGKTWIDGKPIYRITCVNNSCSLTENDWNTLSTIFSNYASLSVDNIVSHELYYVSVTQNKRCNVNAVGMTNEKIHVPQVSQKSNSKVELTIEYTKTTD